MTDKEFKKMIEGKDLSRQEDLDAMFQAINDSENSTSMRKEESFNKKYATLETNFNTMKGEKEAAEKAAKEAGDKLAESEKEKANYKDRAFVYKNIDNTLDDESINEFFALVNAKRTFNDKLSFEDAANEVKAKYFGKQATTAPAPKVEKEPITQSFGVRAHAGSSIDSAAVINSDNSIKSQRARYESILKSGK